MGVQGLTPFLQRTCPDVIKQLPDRFRGLTGKTIVIDGTLITQRLHFAPAPHPYRHVLGWYRLLRELKDSDVRAICVFDGKERSAAKAGEIERRKQVQKKALARSSFEDARSSRLQKLLQLYGVIDSLGEHDRERAINLLRPHIRPSSYNFAISDKIERALLDLVDEDDDITDYLPFNFDRLRSLLTWSEDEHGHNGDTPLASHISQPTHLPAFTSAIATLYSDYRSSISQLHSLTRPTPSPAPHTDPTSTATEDEEEEIEEDPPDLMTKAQYQLTIDEGKLWSTLIDPSSSTTQSESKTTKEALEELARKSSAMSESYQRKANPPSMQTYHESKEILKAMGVPCVEPTGPYEAEALASSLVIRGFADYVASEDTDVLIYEAPLIRNLTNRHVPLLSISGTQVRTALQLSRAQVIDFALLLGTDFSQRIKNVGPTRAFKFIREYGSIEQVLKNETKYCPRVPPQTYLQQVEIARMVFRTLPPVPDANQLQTKESDEDDVAEILQRYELHRAVIYDWDYSSALVGNYFKDDPSAL